MRGAPTTVEQVLDVIGWRSLANVGALQLGNTVCSPASDGEAFRMLRCSKMYSWKFHIASGGETSCMAGYSNKCASSSCQCAGWRSPANVGALQDPTDPALQLQGWRSLTNVGALQPADAAYGAAPRVEKPRERRGASVELGATRPGRPVVGASSSACVENPRKGRGVTTVLTATKPPVTAPALPLPDADAKSPYQRAAIAVAVLPAMRQPFVGTC